eukprot:TRINITY_DN6007_c0_g1_i1.p1 TRINITY_DN6007_c0_g1~~TRINITY_DN6007_c0_g1_i1.p1  ORF type:complete len:567 (-),score=107.14 TRINITY_DN6007_c0_g1_i1:85-1785(-)
MQPMKMPPQMMASPKKAMALQEEFLRRKQLNTYKERRKEGRVIYTASSRTAVICAIAGLLVNLLSLLLPNWRTNWIGVIGYGSSRSWGLWGIQGRSFQLHSTAYQNACKWYGSLMIGGICQSPICKWYWTKCNAYYELMLISFGAGFFLLLAFIFHSLSLYWTVLLTPRTIRWTTYWWPVTAILHIATITLYFILSQNTFDSLDTDSVYPVPNPGASLFMSIIGAVLQVVNTWLAYTLRRMWPEIDPDDSDEFYELDTDSGEDEDFEEETEKKPTAQTGPVYTGPSRQWYYEDRSGKVQGPFPTEQIEQWQRNGSFEPETPFRASDESIFTPFGDGSRLHSGPRQVEALDPTPAPAPAAAPAAPASLATPAEARPGLPPAGGEAVTSSRSEMPGLPPAGGGSPPVQGEAPQAEATAARPATRSEMPGLPPAGGGPPPAGGGLPPVPVQGEAPQAEATAARPATRSEMPGLPPAGGGLPPVQGEAPGAEAPASSTTSDAIPGASRAVDEAPKAEATADEAPGAEATASAGAPKAEATSDDAAPQAEAMAARPSIKSEMPSLPPSAQS